MKKIQRADLSENRFWIFDLKKLAGPQKVTGKNSEVYFSTYLALLSLILNSNSSFSDQKMRDQSHHVAP